MLGQLFERNKDVPARDDTGAIGAALGGNSRQPNKMQEVLRRPEVMAFLLQSAATMLSGGGIGKGIGAGANAVGRYGQQKSEQLSKDKDAERQQAELDRQYSLEERRVGAYERSLANRGGGGGGGGGGGSGAGDMKVKDVQKMLYDQAVRDWEASGEFAEDRGPPPDIMTFLDEAESFLAARRNGMPMDVWTQMRSSGRADLASEFSRDWASDPEGSAGMLEEFNRSANSEAPQDPMVQGPMMPGMGTGMPTQPQVGLPPAMPGGGVGAMPGMLGAPGVPGIGQPIPRQMIPRPNTPILGQMPENLMDPAIFIRNPLR